MAETPQVQAPFASASEPPGRNEPLLREAADCTPAPVWMTDREGAMVFANRAFEESAGVPAAQLMGGGWIDFIHPDDLLAVRDKRAEAWANGHAAYTYEARFRRHDGEWRWWEVSSRPRRDADGNFDGYVGMAIDRTEARAAVQALAESEARLRLAVEAGRMGVWEWDIAANRVQWSPELEALHGLAPGTFPGTFEAFQSDMHPDDREAIVSAITKTLESGRPHEVEYRIIRPDGSMCWVEGRGKLFRDEAGRPLRMVGVCADVTDRKQSQEALRASEERYRAVVESQSEMICRFNNEGQLLLVNEAYAQARNMRADDLIGTNLWAIVPESEQPHVKALLSRLTPAAPEVRIENRVITERGVRWMMWTNRALKFDAEGRWIEAQSTGVDIDERKRAEEQRNLLVAELNHRVKNTLAVVQGIAQQTFRNTDPEARRAYEGRLAALAKAHNLLTERHWETTPLSVVADEVSHVCGAARERIRSAGPDVMLSPRQAVSIVMLLHELCTNALKYGALSNESGVIDLTWRIESKSEPRLEMCWREKGGPPVSAPPGRGYGSVMIERAMAQDLDGVAKLSFEPEGLVCTVSAPISV